MKQPKSANPRHVLIVDDDEAVLDMFASILKVAGHRVTSFSHFEDAKSFLAKEKPDVLISDVRLGAFNGLQLIVFAKLQHPEMTAIVLTGYDDPVMRMEAAHAGATYLVKPVDADTLFEAITPGAVMADDVVRQIPSRPSLR